MLKGLIFSQGIFCKIAFKSEVYIVGDVISVLELKCFEDYFTLIQDIKNKFLDLPVKRKKKLIFYVKKASSQLLVLSSLLLYSSAFQKRV